jgi:hypothetical protein
LHQAKPARVGLKHFSIRVRYVSPDVRVISNLPDSNP